MTKNKDNTTQNAPVVDEEEMADVLLAEDEPSGVEAPVNDSPPYLKIIQAQTDPELQEDFDLGTVVLMPDKVRVADTNTYVRAVPLLAYKCWRVARDSDDPAPYPWAAETLNPNHPIAIRANDFNNRIVPYPDDNNMRYTFEECTKVVWYMETGATAGRQVELAWSGGSAKIGNAFLRTLHSLCHRTNPETAQLERRPAYLFRFDLFSEKRVNANRQQFYVINFTKSQYERVGKALLPLVRDMSAEVNVAYRAALQASTNEIPAELRPLLPAPDAEHDAVL